MSNFDFSLAFYCAPTLAGIKPASLFSVRPEHWASIQKGLIRSGRTFSGRQVYFRKLGENSARVLLMVYRADLLCAHLRLPECRKLLVGFGYNPDASLPALLSCLGGRIGAQGEFPHEIGLFLGYPPEDVRGFIRHGGKNYTLCGCWKVYGDPAQAKQLFSVYEQARCFFCQRVLSGEEIQNIQYGGIA